MELLRVRYITLQPDLTLWSITGNWPMLEATVNVRGHRLVVTSDWSPSNGGKGRRRIAIAPAHWPSVKPYHVWGRLQSSVAYFLWRHLASKQKKTIRATCQQSWLSNRDLPAADGNMFFRSKSRDGCLVTCQTCSSFMKYSFVSVYFMQRSCVQSSMNTKLVVGFSFSFFGISDVSKNNVNMKSSGVCSTKTKTKTKNNTKVRAPRLQNSSQDQDFIIMIPSRFWPDMSMYEV